MGAITGESGDPEKFVVKVAIAPLSEDVDRSFKRCQTPFQSA
jgi:hypothetical protein